MTTEESIKLLSLELARTQMINKSIINLLEKKNILTEEEVLEELNHVIQKIVEESKTIDGFKKNTNTIDSIFSFEQKTGES
jgi:urease gamma subunit